MRFTNIKEINRCTEVEDMILTSADENDISSLADRGRTLQLKRFKGYGTKLFKNLMYM